MVVPGKKNERGRLQLCIRGVNVNVNVLGRNVKTSELVWSPEALRSHFKNGSLRRCKKNILLMEKI